MTGHLVEPRDVTGVHDTGPAAVRGPRVRLPS
jgi:hypothetical protein